VSAKFEFIDGEKALFPILKMCLWLAVSTSGFYEWRDRPASATARRRAQLGVLVEAIFDLSDQTYGHRRVHAQLARQGEACGSELVGSCVSWAWSRASPGRGGPPPPSPATPARPPTWWLGTSAPTRRAPSSSATSPTCRRGRASPTSPP